jgi:hypothetical protein
MCGVVRFKVSHFKTIGEVVAEIEISGCMKGGGKFLTDTGILCYEEKLLFEYGNV